MYSNPTPEQLEKINSYTPDNMEPLEAIEVGVVQIIATDNLLNRSWGKWGVEELPKLAALLPGLPYILNHDWNKVEGSQGLIFDARVEKYENAPDYILKAANNGAMNREIFAKEKYQALITDVAFPIKSPALEMTRFGMLQRVSLGGFMYTKQVCPLCNISFSDEECPHFPPEPMWGLTPQYDPRVAPYYIRAGVYDLGELSAVIIPNIPGAAVVNRRFNLSVEKG
jgi:hypothetical protein